MKDLYVVAIKRNKETSFRYWGGQSYEYFSRAAEALVKYASGRLSASCNAKTAQAEASELRRRLRSAGADQPLDTAWLEPHGFFKAVMVVTMTPARPPSQMGGGRG